MFVFTVLFMVQISAQSHYKNLHHFAEKLYNSTNEIGTSLTINKKPISRLIGFLFKM